MKKVLVISVLSPQQAVGGGCELCQRSQDLGHSLLKSFYTKCLVDWDALFHGKFVESLRLSYEYVEYVM